MQFEVLSEGFVHQTKADTSAAVAAMPRCAVTENGEVVCTFVVQQELGMNDFKPMIARSRDGGETWADSRFIWPHLHDSYCIVGSVSRAPSGELFFFGTRTPIDQPGESFWSDETQVLKQNELLWAKSVDGGNAWPDPTVIPMPIPGSAEAPGAMCIARGGHWLCCYAPYNTFDPDIVVDRNQVVLLRSDDEGETWRHGSMLRFEDADSGGAEAWVVELADGRLLGANLVPHVWSYREKAVDSDEVVAL